MKTEEKTMRRTGETGMSADFNEGPFHSEQGERMTDRIYREDPALLGFIEEEDGKESSHKSSGGNHSGGPGGQGTGCMGCLPEIIFWIILFAVVLQMEGDIPFFLADVAFLIRFFTWGFTGRKKAAAAEGKQPGNMEKLEVRENGNVSEEPQGPGFLEKNKKKMVSAVVVIAAIIAVVLTYGHFRKEQALDEARQYAEEQNISTTYDAAGLIRDKKEFGTELMRLIRWEEETKGQIDRSIRHDVWRDNWREALIYEQVNAFSSSEELKKCALEAVWKEKRENLEKEFFSCLDGLYNTAGEKIAVLPVQQAVKEVYERGLQYGGSYGLSGLCSVLSQAEKGEYEKVFSDERPYNSFYGRKEWDWVSMDMLCLIWPDQMQECGRKCLQEAIDAVDERDLSASISRLDDACEEVSFLQERYGLELNELKPAEELLEQLRDRRRQEQAEAEEQRQQEIRDRLDNSSKNNYYQDPVEPDDHDLDGYYEDYKDEYEDIDDAWDGFMDDEDAWEDY